VLAAATLAGSAGRADAEATPVDYRCDGEAVAINFPVHSTAPVSDFLTSDAVATYQFDLPPVPAGSTVTGVALDTRPPFEASGQRLDARTGEARATGGNLALTATTVDAAGSHLQLSGNEPAASAVVPTVTVHTYIDTRGISYGGTPVVVVFPYPSITVTTDAGTVRCTPDPRQSLGSVTVYPLPTTRRAESTTTTTTTTTPRPTSPVHPLCAYRPRVAPWLWRLLVGLFGIHC
jgi:hypothetical protein